MKGNGIKIDNFKDLFEVVCIQNFEERNENELKPNFKKAVKIGSAFKKAIKIGDAPQKVKKGEKFTPRKLNHHGRMIHFTNAKNSFKRSQKRKSVKGKRK